ncbi:MAG: S8 family serine peptidase [Proteobacteria bacterium]|nr:S8 family serine peptidase [Pseudomonadota bacterium]
MNAPRRTTSPVSRRASRAPALACLAIALGVLSLPAVAQVTPSQPQWVPGRLLVQPRPGLSDTEFDKILKPHGGKQVGKIDKINVRIIQLPAQASEKAVEALLKNNKHLKFAERDMILPQALAVSDPYYGSEWHVPKIGADAAWDLSSGAGVTIAILDSGVDSTHPDLAGRLVPGWNFYDNNSNTADVNGHGTQVAGTAAAESNNGVGVAGVAGGARIMPVRVASSTGSGSLTAIASGLTWAADQGARVANLSFYGVSSSSAILSAAQYMKNKGGLVTVSAGNYGTEAPFPATDAMIIVSATDSNDVKTSWSSYGAYVDVAAPGAGIYTTTNGGGYGAVSGTSFSAPITAGVVALMMAANPGLGAATIEKLLFSSATDLGTVGFDTYYGYGRVNAAAAVQAAASTRSAADTTAPSVSISNPGAGATVKGLITVDVAASDNVGVSRVDLVVNGNKIASDTSAPYGFSWDSTTVADGNVTLTAYAYDAAGNASNKSVSVVVSNASATPDTVAPVATISNPTSGSAVSGTVSVQASASDNVNVVAIRLYVDGKLTSSASASSLSYSWNTRKLAAGSHTLLVEADDAAGNKGSQTVQVVR